jgi:uncharacterized protein YndB with AHSA1/START domain
MIHGDSVIHEIEYPAAPEQVWRALVDPQILAQWLMPNDFAPVAGRHFSMGHDPIGRIEAEVLEVDPPRRLACRWTGAFGDTIVTFEVTPTTTGTRLRVEQRGWTAADTAGRDQLDSGWPGKLDALRGLLAAGLVRPGQWSSA